MFTSFGGCGARMMRGVVISVNVGTPQRVSWNGRDFTTAIRKHPVIGSIAVGGVNIDGDDQADRSVHGGLTKAVYAYSLEDYAYWQRRLGVQLEPGTFGENLTIDGIAASQAVIGERWRVGSTLLEVSEPRIPCYKLGYRMRDPAFPRIFAQALLPGAYLRISEPGNIEAGNTIVVESRPNHGISTSEVSRIRLFSPQERRKLLEADTLSLAWRGWALE